MKHLRVLTSLAFFILIVLIILNLPPMLQRFLPLSFTDLILYYGTSFQIEPALIAAVIHVESSFNPEAVSKKGARGLMQLMPETAAWLAEQKGQVLTSENIFEPERNIELGTYYLNSLMKRFSHEYLALAAYNAGPTTVQRWLDEGLWDGSLIRSGQIPFAETKYYLRKVIVLRQLYRFIYQEELQF